MRVTVCLLALAGMAVASPDAVNRAQELYQHTQYQNSLKILSRDPAPDVAPYLLTGKNYFMMADYKKATEFFEKCVSLTPNSSATRCKRLAVSPEISPATESTSRMAVNTARRCSASGRS